jgi:hypothetical protein
MACGSRASLLAWAGAGLAAVLPVALAAHGPGPGPGCTGGFGEPTCASCHVDVPTDGVAGTLSLDGLPASVVPGTRYALRLTISRPGMTRAGFALAARIADGPAGGQQAGRLEPVDATVQVLVGSSSSVQYATHTAAGSRASEPGSLAWHLVWTAPRLDAGPVIFHVAANASNGDESALGDSIYTTAVTVRRE